MFFGHTYLCVFFKFRSIFGNILFFDPLLQREVNKKSRLKIYHTYHKNLTSVARYLGSIYFWYKKSRKWPQDHYFPQKVLFYPFSTQYYNRKEEKKLDFSYTNHIARTSRVWQDIWGPDIFNTKKVKNGLRIIIFHKKCYLPIFDPILILQREGRKKYGLQLYHPYHKNLKSVASYLGSISF